MDPGLPEELRDIDLKRFRILDIGFNGAQIEFVKFFQKGKTTYPVWVGGEGDPAPDQKKCVENTCNWIQQLAERADKGYIDGEEDDGFPGFQCLRHRLHF